MPSAYQKYILRHHFGSLNGLRCLCIFAVLWHHSPATELTSGLRLTERGFVGVDFFFVLSGFLITTLLLREQDRTGRISLARFYWKRALRILPAYFLLVTAVSVYWIIYKGHEDLLSLVPYYYFFLANFLQSDIPLLSITWSLSVEEQYYLLWPLLLVILPAAVLPRVVVLTGLIMISFLAMLGLDDFLGLPRITTNDAVFSLPGMSYMAILIGSFLAILLHNPRGYHIVSRLCGSRPAPLLLFVILLIYLQFAPINLIGWPSLVMDILMALCVAALVMREDHFARPLMHLRPIARIGEISYGIYLYHLIGLHITHVLIDSLNIKQNLSAWLVTVTFPIISIAISEISFQKFERHFLYLKKYY